MDVGPWGGVGCRTLPRPEGLPCLLLVVVSTSVTAAATKAADLTAPGQVEVLALTGRAGERLLATTSQATTTGTVSVRNPAGDEIGFGRDDVKETDPTGPTTLPSAGTYTVVLTPDGYQTGSVTVLLRDSTA